MDIPRPYLEKIREAYPGLRITDLRLNRDGLINDVVVVNGELACRFPRTDRARERLRHEARVLDLVRRHVRVAVPAFEHLEAGFASYRFLPGEPLTRALLLRLAPAERRRMLGEVARFVRDLHSIPVDEAAAAGVGASDTNRTHERWLALYAAAREELFPLLWEHQRAFVDELFEPVATGALDLAHAPALVSGDLPPYHLLFDRDACRLAAVIDFGTAGLGDPAADLAVFLYHYGETLAREMEPVYPGLFDHLDRARFWAGTLEVQWALAGARGERRLAVAHLGGARDLMPVGAP